MSSNEERMNPLGKVEDDAVEFRLMGWELLL